MLGNPATVQVIHRLPFTLAWLHMMKAISASMLVGPRYRREGSSYRLMIERSDAATSLPK